MKIKNVYKIFLIKIMKVVISLGGSLITPKDDFLEKVADFIKKTSKKIDLYVVVGGGKIAKNYIKVARKFCNDERFLDKIGIAATRLNAFLLASFFKKTIPYTVKKASTMQPPVIMGGTTPGHSTDAVAAMLAKKVKADLLVIATDVDGIYDKDPKKYRNAKKFDKIKIDDLIKIVGNKWKKAGEKIVVDAIACKIIKKEKIRAVVLNGKDLKQLENAIYGKKFNGTIIEIS